MMTFNPHLQRLYQAAQCLMAVFCLFSYQVSQAAQGTTIQDKIAFTAILRDFPYYGLSNPNARVGNPYFQNELDTTGPNTADDKTGRKNSPCVWDVLDANGRPQFAGFIDGTTTWAGGSYADLKGYFDEMWGKKYKSNEENIYNIPAKTINVGMEVPGGVARTDKGLDGQVVKGKAYRYKWIQTSDNKPNVGFPGFFPIDTYAGWSANPAWYGKRRITGYDGQPHNFCFTAEMTGTLTLPKDTEAVSVTADADDDIWVYINGRLVSGYTIRNGQRTRVVSNTIYDVRPKAMFMLPPPNITPGEPMTIKIFFAERKTPGSSIIFLLDVFTNEKLLNPGSGDKLNIAAKAVPNSDTAKIWFDASQTSERAFTLE